MIGTGAFQLKTITRSGRARPLPALLGRSTAARRRRAHVLRRRGGDVARAAEPARSTLPPAVAAGGARPSGTTADTRSTPRRRRTLDVRPRVDRDPFKDPRVRRRSRCPSTAPRSSTAVQGGHARQRLAVLGRFPSTDRSVPQRKQNIALAKELLGRRPATRSSRSRREPVRSRSTRQMSRRRAGRPGSTSSSTS